MLHPDVKDFFFKHGTQYKPAKFPRELKRGKVSDCFDTSLMNAAFHKKYRYVEGIAQHPNIAGLWILHAWLTDADGENAYDPTWRSVSRRTGNYAPVETSYIGIEIPTDTIIEFIVQTEYKSLFANGWRNIELAKAAVPGFPFEVCR